MKIRSFFLLVILLLAPLLSRAGTWTQLTHTAPNTIYTMLLLTDGTVIGTDANGGCYKLTPSSTGSYLNGTWTTLASMNDTRLYFSSDVLKDGRVWVAGGEYGSGGSTCEIYDPPSNTWTPVTNVLGGEFLDSDSKILPNGNVLISPVFPTVGGIPLIFDTVLNTFVQGPSYVRGFNQDETSWVKLPDDSMLTIDPFGTNSERYIPSLNKWVNDANVPELLFDGNEEMGAALLLPNGNAFYIGAASRTVIYTPSGTTNMGSWAAGADIPNGLGAPDAPAAMMVNGKILCALGPSGTYDGPTSFYEYDYLNNTFTAISSPNGNFYPPLTARMLDLPDGNVLFSFQDARVYIYTPDGSPLALGKPTINSIITNSDDSYRLTGLQLNGISEGAAYGDDAQMDTDYPIIRMTNIVTGKVFYARTYNWSSASVMASNKVSTTEFTVPSNLPAGTYSLVVTANGIASDPVTFIPGAANPTMIPLTNSDTAGNSSFNSGLNWSNSLAPASLNNYQVSGRDLFTPHTNSDLIFQGGSLYLTNGGALRIEATGNGNVISVGMPPGRALTMSGGVVSDSAGQPEVLAGYITLINSNNIIDAQSTTFTIASAIGGTGSLTIESSGGTVTLRHTNTYTGNTIIGAGTLALIGQGSINNSADVSISNNATLDVTGRDDQTLTIDSGKVLQGSGTILGQLSTGANSTLLPGDAIGKLTVSGDVILSGTLVMELNRTNAVTNDKLVSSTGILTGGGTLTVTNLGPALHLGDTFQLFNQPVSGFAIVNLPDVSPNAWINKLGIDGTIQVVVYVSTTPVNITLQAARTNLSLRWPSDHIGWRLQSQTNSVVGTNWVDVPGANATNMVLIPINLLNTCVFYRLIYP